MYGLNPDFQNLFIGKPIKSMEKFRNVILFGLSFIWMIPQNLVALVMMPFLGKLRLISYRNLCFCFEGQNMSGGISLGNFAFVSPYSAKNEAVVAHEQLGHTHDSQLFGPLYLLIIGLPSILHAWLHTDCPCYYHFFTEKRANKFANVEVKYTFSGRCYLSLKK